MCVLILRVFLRLDWWIIQMMMKKRKKRRRRSRLHASGPVWAHKAVCVCVCVGLNRRSAAANHSSRGWWEASRTSRANERWIGWTLTPGTEELLYGGDSFFNEFFWTFVFFNDWQELLPVSGEAVINLYNRTSVIQARFAMLVLKRWNCSECLLSDLRSALSTQHSRHTLDY